MRLAVGLAVRLAVTRSPDSAVLEGEGDCEHQNTRWWRSTPFTGLLRAEAAEGTFAGVSSTERRRERFAS
jgi:hypothetical protein